MKTKNMILTLVLLLISTAAWAQGHGGGCVCGKSSSSRVAWEIDHPVAAHQAAASSVFALWNNYIDIFNPRAGNNIAGKNNTNEIFFFGINQVKQEYGFTIDATTFGFAPMTPLSAFGNPPFNQCPMPAGTQCGIFTETDVVINAEFARGWTTQGPPDFDDDNGPAYYQATAAHELGHTLGLHHNFNNLSVMNYYEDFAAQYVALSDVMIARQHYPGNVRTVVDLATYPFYYNPAFQQYDAAYPVRVAPTSIQPGGRIQITNVTLENLSTSAQNSTVLRFYLSQDATITTSDIHIGNVTFSAVPVNSFWDDGGKGIQIDLPPNVPPGTYYVGAMVLYNGTTADPIAYNNTWVAHEKLTVIGSGGGGGPCVADSRTLCLNNGRFRLRADWKDFGNNTGSGTAVPLSADTGYFWFFNSANVELVVKVLDGRPVNSRFWVFYGALSNVQYTITVTDTQTGQVKTYFNPPGHFGSVGDTTAF
jgi:hypothetical protein